MIFSPVTIDPCFGRNSTFPTFPSKAIIALRVASLVIIYNLLLCSHLQHNSVDIDMTLPCKIQALLTRVLANRKKQRHNPYTTTLSTHHAD